MCGIFGYVGGRTAAPILVDGLRTLEYRGYDSAGIFVPGGGVVKATGPIDNLASKITTTIPGTAGIAHTRWATHGAPTEINAHPHTDMAEMVWLVHNGIIENFRQLRDMLIMQDITCQSETDTEVLAKLIGSYYTGDLLAAVKSALGMVSGTYGIAVMSERNPGEIIVARMGSPIVLGIGTEGHFVSSDPSALLEHTKDVVYLYDGDIATITAETYRVRTANGKRKQRPAETIEWDKAELQKSGYDHFMLKEIMEIPEVVRNTIRGRLSACRSRVKLGGLEAVLDDVLKLDQLVIASCGSAYLAGSIGRHLLEEYANLSTQIELASEYRYKKHLLSQKGALLVVSQSGETADTIAALRLAKELNQLTLGIVNVVGSTIARETDAGVHNHAGPEVAVASTKAFISEVVVFALITLLLARKRGMTVVKGNEIVQALETLPSVLEAVLSDTKAIKALAEKYANYKNMMFIGRKSHQPVAFEGALKLKEITYIHAEAYAGGELKHGPIAMLDSLFPVVAIAPKDDVYDKMISNIEEVKARGAPVLALATSDDRQIEKITDDVIYVPRVHPIVQPIVSTVPLHLFAYYVGVSKGLNVDRPRNLAKSVTVE